MLAEILADGVRTILVESLDRLAHDLAVSSPSKARSPRRLPTSCRPSSPVNRLALTNQALTPQVPRRAKAHALRGSAEGVRDRRFVSFSWKSENSIL